LGSTALASGAFAPNSGSFSGPDGLELELPERHSVAFEDDRDRAGSRHALVFLIEIALRQRPIPIQLAARVWEVLKILADDLDPTPDDEARYSGSNLDPANLAINTTVARVSAQ
jgi:hypothetical protein